MKIIAFFRKLSLKAEKNWHQNRGANRREVIRDVDIIRILEAGLVEKSLVCLVTQGRSTDRSADKRYFASRNNVPSNAIRWRTLEHAEGDARPKLPGGDRRSGRIEAHAAPNLSRVEAAPVGASRLDLQPDSRDFDPIDQAASTQEARFRKAAERMSRDSGTPSGVWSTAAHRSRFELLGSGRIVRSRRIGCIQLGIRSGATTANDARPGCSMPHSTRVERWVDR
jgi:hypothetical protein